MVISQHCYANLYMQVGCACKVIRVHREMETSLSDFNNKRYLQQLRKINARDPSGSKQSEAGAYAPNEYGSTVLYGFPPQYSKIITGAAYTRTVNYEIRDPALRVGGG